MEEVEPEGRKPLTPVQLTIAVHTAAGRLTCSQIGALPEVDLGPSQVCRIQALPPVRAYVDEIRRDSEERNRTLFLEASASAALAVLDLIPEMVRIAQGRPDPAGEGEDGYVPAHAARVAAFTALHKVATANKLEVSGPRGGPIEVDMRTDAERLRDAAANMAAADIGLPPVPEGGAYGDG